MSRKLLIPVLVALFTFSTTKANAQNKDVEVVIASTLNMAQAVAFSPDNRFVAQALYNTISIWDVKTGRMLRSCNYSDNLGQVTDTIWFSEDSKKVVIGLAATNDHFKMEVETGKSEFFKGEPMDYSNYTYQMSNLTKATMHLYSGSKEDLIFPAPDGSSELVYKIIKNPYGNSNVVPFAFETHIRTDKKMSKPIDTVMQACFVFSPDSRYVFTESHIMDLKTSKEVSQLKAVPFSGTSVMFLPDTRIPVTSGVHSIRIWDFPDIEDIHIKDMINFIPSIDGKFLICEAYNMESNHHMYYKVDLEKRKKVGKTINSKESGYLLNVNNDASMFCYLQMIKKSTTDMSVDYFVKVCDVASGKVVRTIPGTTKCFFTPDPNIVMIDSIGRGNFAYDLKSGNVSYFSQDEQFINSGFHMMSDDHNYILTSKSLNADENGVVTVEVQVWDVNTRTKIFTAEIKGINISGFNVSRDQSTLSFASSYGNIIYIYDMKSGNQLAQLTGHQAIVKDTRFSDDAKRLISSSLDGTRRVWNLEEKSEMVSLINTGRKDYAIVTPEQYYYATKGAKKLIHFVKGVEIFPFAQFDLKYNRPDIIIESMEASNQSLVKPFYYAYQKRLKRLGFTEEMLDGEFHMPEANIDNANGLPITTKDRKIKLDISATDEKFNLDRLLIRVNEVPIHGKRGKSLKDNESKSLNVTEEIALSAGPNFIQVSVMNEKGVESLGSNVVIEFEPEKGHKPNLYLYTIGVSEYEQSEFNLTYAAKDAGDIQTLFAGDQMPFNQIIAHSLTNDQVTVETVQSIKNELKKTNVDDAVCVFFAGHGVLDVELNYYLAAHDMDFKSPSEKGIPYEVFEDILDEIPARKKLIMIDACHSGEIDKDEVALIEEENTTENDGDISFRAVTSTSLTRVGLNNSFELMKELFNDVKKNSGTVVISSAGGMEYAMEGGEWNNGVFTYCFLNGIKSGKADLNKDGKIMLSEMSTFVRAEVFELTGGRQQPTNRVEVLETDWQLW